MMDCPLGAGMFYLPDRKMGLNVDPLYLGTSYAVQDSHIVNGQCVVTIVKNDSGGALDAGQKIRFVGHGHDAEAVVDSYGSGKYDAVVEEFYLSGVPAGAWFRARMKSHTEIMVEKLDEIIALLSAK